jgi:hypothetical protein
MSCQHIYLGPVLLDSPFLPDRNHTFIFNPFCFSGPDPILVSLFCLLSHYISFQSLIVMVPITSKSFFFYPTHPFFVLTRTSPFQMATTCNQDLQTSINQAHVSIKHLI